MRYIQIVHALPGRTRLRCPDLRRDREACDRVADALVAIAGVRDVKVRPYTGSMLVEHDPTLEAAALADAAGAALRIDRVLAQHERAPDDGAIPELSRIAKLAASAFRQLDRDILRMTGGRLDLGTLTTLGFFGAGALEIAAEKEIQMPPWFNLAWWGYRTFVTAEQDEIESNGDGPPAHIAG